MAMEQSPTFNTGEKPPANGVYQCHKCGKFAIIQTAPNQELPNCPKCKTPTMFFQKTR